MTTTVKEVYGVKKFLAMLIVLVTLVVMSGTALAGARGWGLVFGIYSAPKGGVKALGMPAVSAGPNVPTAQ